MQGSFVSSSFRSKTDVEKRQANYRRTKMRYLALLLACLVVFGCEYCFDTPSVLLQMKNKNSQALQTDIKENYEKENQQQLRQAKFNLLYSLYSFPNVIVPLIGGILIDKIGSRLMLTIVAAICTLGHAVFSFGGLENAFVVMLVGRVIFGIGGEVLHTAQNTLISNWFKASQLSMALGICISIPKLGSSLNSVLSPTVGKSFKEEGSNLNVAAPLLLGLIFMGFSLAMGVVLFVIDRKTQKKEQNIHESALLSEVQTPKLPKKSNLQRLRSNQSAGRLFSFPSVEISTTSHVSERGQPSGDEKLNFAAIKELPGTFWILMLVAMLSEALFIPFLDNGNEYYQTVFKGINDPESAGIYLVLPYIVSSVLVLPMGYFVDRFGKRDVLLIYSTGFVLVTYLFIMYLEASVELRSTNWIRWVPSTLLGTCVAIFCTVVVPTVPMLVKPELLGTSLGIMEVGQNFALGLFPILAGSIRQTAPENDLEGFHLQTLFFFIMACVCFSASVWLKALDSVTGCRLGDAVNFRKKYVQEVLDEKDTD